MWRLGPDKSRLESRRNSQKEEVQNKPLIVTRRHAMCVTECMLLYYHGSKLRSCNMLFHLVKLIVMTVL